MYYPSLFSLALTLIFIVINNRTMTRIHTEQIKALKDTQTAQNEIYDSNFKELYDRTRFMMTTQEILEQLEKHAENDTQTHKEQNLRMHEMEKRFMEELKAIHKEITEIRVRTG